MNNNAIFITATGTDVGKTYISGLLVKKLRENNISCGYYKPALSGAIKQNDGTLLAGDCDFVNRISGLNAQTTNLVSYCFEEAVSPHLAASRKGVEISLEKIKEDYKRLSSNYDYMIVEGAGGITCPFKIKEDEVILLPEIIKNLELDIIIVADGGLGTINSVILTVEYARSQKINIKGIILNNFDETNFMHNDNKIQVEKLTGIPIIATVQKNSTNINIELKNLLKLF